MAVGVVHVLFGIGPCPALRQRDVLELHGRCAVGFWRFHVVHDLFFYGEWHIGVQRFIVFRSWHFGFHDVCSGIDRDLVREWSILCNGVGKVHCSVFCCSGWSGWCLSIGPALDGGLLCPCVGGFSDLEIGLAAQSAVIGCARDLRYEGIEPRIGRLFDRCGQIIAFKVGVLDGIASQRGQGVWSGWGLSVGPAFDGWIAYPAVWQIAAVNMDQAYYGLFVRRKAFDIGVVVIDGVDGQIGGELLVVCVQILVGVCPCPAGWQRDLGQGLPACSVRFGGRNIIDSFPVDLVRNDCFEGRDVVCSLDLGAQEILSGVDEWFVLPWSVLRCRIAELHGACIWTGLRFRRLSVIRVGWHVRVFDPVVGLLGDGKALACLGLCACFGRSHGDFDDVASGVCGRLFEQNEVILLFFVPFDGEGAVGSVHIEVFFFKRYGVSVIDLAQIAYDR